MWLDGPRLEDSGSYKTVEFLRRVLTNHFSYTVYKPPPPHPPGQEAGGRGSGGVVNMGPETETDPSLHDPIFE
jgi:hypothetical protein